MSPDDDVAEGAAPSGDAQEVPVAGRLGEDLEQAVMAFHRRCGRAIREIPNARPEEYVRQIHMLREEMEEYTSAAARDDVVEVADALADMVYVLFGTALVCGVDLPAVLAEVHRANMSKLSPDRPPRLRADGKVLKGPNYVEPDVAQVMTPRRPRG